LDFERVITKEWENFEVILRKGERIKQRNFCTSKKKDIMVWNDENLFFFISISLETSINVSFYFLLVGFGLLGELGKQKQLILIIILFLLIPIQLNM
jgi:hypothetical protein